MGTRVDVGFEQEPALAPHQQEGGTTSSSPPQFSQWGSRTTLIEDISQEKKPSLFTRAVLPEGQLRDEKLQGGVSICSSSTLLTKHNASAKWLDGGKQPGLLQA